jgi:hypothetical protein
MKIITLLLLTITLYASQLSQTQQSNLQYAYNFAKRFNLENSVRAIVMVESSGGINVKNPNVYACGWGQIYVKSWRNRYVPNNNFSDEAICKILIKDIDLNLLAIIAELKFWQDIHGNNWNKIYASYYAGYNYSSPEAITYSNKVIKWIKLLR